jgi:hypothetical protein
VRENKSGTRANPSKRSAKQKLHVIMKSISISAMWALLITLAFLGTGCASAGSRPKASRINSTSTAPFGKDSFYHASEGWYNSAQRDGDI